jgi:glutamate synthase domain-containing protein 3
MIIDANGKNFRQLNEEIKASPDSDVTVLNCLGQRYIGTGAVGKRISVRGIPGNGLGAYLKGTDIHVERNAQDAVGDTMNDGAIVVNGNIGDAAGYGMRGGRIYVRGNAGYRCGIHMKAYEGSSPAIVVGGHTGSFLGEYQAGGTIIVLGMGLEGGRPNITGDYCGTGIHGGSIYLRTDRLGVPMSEKAILTDLYGTEDASLCEEVDRYCETFGFASRELLHSRFWRIEPDSKNPYRTLYHYY